MDKVKQRKCANIRDQIHNLVIDFSDGKTELDDPVFSGYLQQLMLLLEGKDRQAYIDDDTSSSITVGLGFNMDRGASSRNEWRIAFGDEVSFDDVYSGKTSLTDKQIDRLFTSAFAIRLPEIHVYYGGRKNWQKLRANEMLVIHSAHYNGPKVVKRGTEFREHIMNYIKTDDTEYLKKAASRLRRSYDPNAKNANGMRNRREAEATLLESNHSPVYTKPSESPDSKNQALVGVTVVPSKERLESRVGGSERDANSEYFIWRTAGDHKVRAEHMLYEGRVFRRDSSPTGYMPGTQHNCRCTAEPVPDDLIIIDQLSVDKAMNLYLRKGIVSPILRFNLGHVNHIK